jgi:hypothetical protein
MAEVPISAEAQSLYVDPTPAFQGALGFIEKQRNQANERYAENKADIANIFGQLTQVNQESQNRVNKQFTDSVTNQQMATAQRVAEARLGAQQTQQSALQAMDERGGGPVGNLAASPVAVEAERGIGRQNALQTIFAGQQGAIQQQTIQNLMAAQQGYGQQRLGAEAGLNRSLEDVLLGLSGQEANVRGDLAAAKLAGRQTVRQANYQQILQRQAEAEARRLAAIRGQYDVQQAAIDAQNKLDLAELNAKNRIVDYPNDSNGISRYLQDQGVTDTSEFWATVDSVDLTGVTTGVAAYNKWLADNRSKNPSQAVKNAARDWFNRLKYGRATTTQDYGTYGVQTPGVPGTLPGSTLPNG